MGEARVEHDVIGIEPLVRTLHVDDVADLHAVSLAIDCGKRGVPRAAFGRIAACASLIPAAGCGNQRRESVPASSG
jgi:hypothetical protein